MKSILNVIYQFFYDYGRVRAATEMARRGEHELAKAIMRGI